jgi:hypothetical protein
VKQKGKAKGEYGRNFPRIPAPDYCKTQLRAKALNRGESRRRNQLVNAKEE